MLANIYPSSVDVYGWKVCAGSGMITFGSTVGLFLASFIRRLKWFMFVWVIIGTAFTGAVAVCTQHNEKLTVSLMVVGCFSLGIVEAVVLTLSSIAIKDQVNIGAAVGFAASIRSLGGALASTIYTTIIANRLKALIPQIVVPAVVAAGLPATSLPSLLQALQGLIPTDKVPGLTPEILAIATDTYRTANSKAYSTCFLVSIAFCGIAIIATYFCGDVTKEKENMVVRELHHKSDEKRLEEMVQKQ